LAGVAPPSVIVVCGLSGTGKSHVAKQLAEQLAAAWLSTDTIRRALRAPRSPAIGATNATRPANVRSPASFGAGDYSADRRGEVYAELSRRLPEALRERGLVIVDGTFGRSAQRAELSAAAKAANASLLFLHCRCPQDIARARVRERALRESSDSEIQPDMLERQASEAEPFRVGEPVVEVDTSDAPGCVVREALDAVRNHF
jgi:predicted kinase